MPTLIVKLLSPCYIGRVAMCQTSSPLDCIRHFYALILATFFFSQGWQFLATFDYHVNPLPQLSARCTISFF